jgi:hypothetical protein
MPAGSCRRGWLPPRRLSRQLLLCRIDVEGRILHTDHCSRKASLTDLPVVRQISERFDPSLQGLSSTNTVKPAAPKHEFHQPFQPDLGRPDCAAKIFRFSFPPNQLHLRAIPPHRRGAYASSRYVECGMRWTRGARAREALQGGLRLGLGAVSDRSAQDERRCCVRQKRVVLAPVAGVKLAEVFASPTGFAKPSIRQRWRQEEFVSRESAP